MSGSSQPVHPQARPAANNGQEQAQAPATRQKRKRAPSQARPVFVVAQMLDDGGNPVPFNKKQLKILRVELSAEKVLEITEGGEFSNSFYLRLLVPPRQAQNPARAASQPHNAATA